MTTTQITDQAGEVRNGEALDIAAVQAWLQQHSPIAEGLPDVTQYAGGASNWTYCLQYPDTQVILRRAPAGTKAKGAHDMAREYRLQKALKPVYPYVPQMLACCEDDSVIGSPFYVMEKLSGVIPRKNMPRSLVLSKATTQTLCTSVLDRLIELHQVDIETPSLQRLGKGHGYVSRQIDGWCKRYSNAHTWNVPRAKRVMNWLQDNQPEKERICLIHNDFRFDNVVLDPNDITRVVGILDWELATLGDPLMDLGNTLAYWVQADDDFLAQSTRRQPTHLPGMLTRSEVRDYYARHSGLDVSHFTFYEVYGLFRLAGIAQQIYYRYYHKQTRNPAFKRFWIFVHYLIHRCHKAIRQA